MSGIEHFWAVVPAGGAGTRLWPLSRSTTPKFLHDLTGSGRSLLQETHDRLVPLAGERVVVVTGRAHRDAVTAQLPSLGPDGVIADRDAFAACVRLAVEAAGHDWLVTLGVEPTSASSAFGYIHVGPADLPGLRGVRPALEFVEKPSAEVATAYLATGSYRWNAGMFVVRPRVLLDLLGAWHPEFAATLRAIAADESRLDELWPTLPRIALDHAVAEPAARATRVAVVPASFDWEDIGDFDSLAGLLAGPPGSTEGEPTVLGDATLVRAVDATGLVVPRAGRLVAVVGLEDVVVVDTPDALLVTTRARAQEVKQVVAGLREAGRGDLT